MQADTELRVDPNKVYRRRAKALKSKLPLNYRAIVFEHYPEYKTKQGRLHLTMVLMGQSPDLKVTEILEKIAAKDLKLKQDTPTAEVPGQSDRKG